MPSLRLIKSQERWENNVRIAIHQSELMKKNWHLYHSNTINVVKRYKGWLQRHKMESDMNLDLIN
jgi:hypothetical protein